MERRQGFSTAAWRLSGIGILMMAALVPEWGWRDGSFERALGADGLRIGYAQEPPYAFSDDTGIVTGESPAIATHVALELGVRRIEWVQTSFDALIPDLQSGRIDLIASGMFVTAERSRIVNFSLPTFQVRPSLLVRGDSRRELHSLRDIVRQPDVRIAVLSGAVEGPRLLEGGVAGSQLVAVPDAVAGVAAVHSRLADGLALSAPSLRWIAEHDPTGQLVVSSPFEWRECEPGFGAFAFRQSDVRLLHAWNLVLTRFLGSAAHRRLVADWGFGKDELTGRMTLAEVRGR